MTNRVHALCVLQVLTLAHWLACFWGVVGHMGSSMKSETDEPTSWMEVLGIVDKGASYQYAVCLHSSMAAIFGSAVIQPVNMIEYICQSLMMLFGSALWSYIIAAGCGIISTLDPQGVEYRQTMDELNYFARRRTHRRPRAPWPMSMAITVPRPSLAPWP